MTLHEKRGAGLSNAPGAMLVYDTAGCGGERVSMKCFCIWAVVCRTMTLHDERGEV